MERTTSTDGRIDDLATHVDQRFDRVDQRFDTVDRRFEEMRHDTNHWFDRVEGDLKELRQIVWYLWGSMLIGFLVVIATVLVGGH